VDRPTLLNRASIADVIIAASLAVATCAVCAYFAPRGFQGGFVDMAHDGYQLRQALDLSRGAVIFRDTFDQYGALNGYLNTIGFLAFGHRLLAIKYFAALWYALTAVALYVIARRWTGPLLAGFSGLVWLGLAPFYQHGVMLSPHVYALLFQTVATIIALSAPGLDAGRFAAVGVLAGLSWSVKQSLGALYLLAVLAYLLSCGVVSRAGWRRAAKSAAAMSIAFFAVVAIVLAWLWTAGALHDWYLQTVVFPREFYLQQLLADRGGITSSVWMAPLNFARLQIEWPSWVVIRVVVLVAASIQIVRRRAEPDLLLIAWITAFLWLAAYPSANFMHQWWTASLTIPAFVACVGRWNRARMSSGSASWMTIAIVAAIAASGMADRAAAAVARRSTLTETITRPAMLRGIRTDPSTKRAFDLLYTLMTGYRDGHPGATVVSIDAADGWRTGIAAGLPFLSFFDDNRHVQPVYWSLPALSTTVYPRYGETLWQYVRSDRPLIIDHRNGPYQVVRIAGYRLLAAAQSDSGYWFLYGPQETVPEAQAPLYLAKDSATGRRFSEDVDAPQFAAPKRLKRLEPGAEGAWRTRVMQGAVRDAVIRVGGPAPLNLDDPWVARAVAPVDVYTWPADLLLARIDRPLEPLSTELFWRAGRGDIVRDFRGGAWTVDGEAERPLSYLLQWPEETVSQDASLVVRGELFEGGVQIGLLNHGKWSGFVDVTRPGVFEVVLQVQKTGQYAVIVANLLESTWWQRVQPPLVRALLNAQNRRLWLNRFRVTDAGWLRPQPDGAVEADAGDHLR